MKYVRVAVEQTRQGPSKTLEEWAKARVNASLKAATANELNRMLSILKNPKQPTFVGYKDGVPIEMLNDANEAKDWLNN